MNEEKQFVIIAGIGAFLFAGMLALFWYSSYTTHIEVMYRLEHPQENKETP